MFPPAYFVAISNSARSFLLEEWLKSSSIRIALVISHKLLYSVISKRREFRERNPWSPRI